MHPESLKSHPFFIVQGRHLRVAHLPHLPSGRPRRLKGFCWFPRISFWDRNPPPGCNLRVGISWVGLLDVVVGIFPVFRLNQCVKHMSSWWWWSGAPLGVRSDPMDTHLGFQPGLLAMGAFVGIWTPTQMMPKLKTIKKVSTGFVQQEIGWQDVFKKHV